MDSVLILFPDNLNVCRGGVDGSKINCFPREQSLNDLLYIAHEEKNVFVYKFMK